MELILVAQPREIIGKRASLLRHKGLLPGVLYGPKQKSLSLQVDQKDFEKVYKQAGENTLINLKLGDSGQHKVLIHQVAKHFMKNQPIHVDFYAVDLKKKIHAKVPLHFEGVTLAVKELGGVLLTILTEVEVQALPTELPSFIEVDLSKLVQFNDQIHLSDLPVGEGVEVVGRLEEVVATVKAPRTQAEIEALDEKVSEEDEVKAVAGEEEEEGEEGEEGEEKKDEKDGADKKDDDGGESKDSAEAKGKE